MNNKASLILFFLFFLVACNNNPKATSNEQIPEENPEQIKPQTTNAQNTTREEPISSATSSNSIDGVRLYKTKYFRSDDHPEYVYYESKKDSVRYSFHTKTSFDYGVLEKNYNDLMSTDYFVFLKPKKLDSTLVLHLKDTVFTKKHKDMDPEYEEPSEMDQLLQDYAIVTFPSDGDIDAATINIRNQIVRHFGSAGEGYQVSPDQKSLKIWHSSEKEVKLDTICPELLKIESAYYELGEAFIYELASGKETSMGEYGCLFVQ
ncbi:hypothetical protein [Aquimarina sp. SS2-1]|uniref:hypothetical protein n=1 Tax=Aquimarina besae TaxID=3342247 RepID=UPI003670E385